MLKSIAFSIELPRNLHQNALLFDAKDEII